MIGGLGATVPGAWDSAWDSAVVVLLLGKWQHLRLVLPYSSKDFL